MRIKRKNFIKNIISFITASVILISFNCSPVFRQFIVPQTIYATDAELACEYAMQILYKNEGSYTSVTLNDNGALSIGKLQWHGTNALNLLKNIINANQNQALSYLGINLYNEIINSSNWSTRIVSVDEATLLRNFLNTTESKNIQDYNGKEWIRGYINSGINLGLRGNDVLVYYADMANQGPGFANGIASIAKSTCGSYSNISLSLIHETAMANQYKYFSNWTKWKSAVEARRIRTYDYCSNIEGDIVLKWYERMSPVNVGDSFDAIIINTNLWKPIRTEGSNIVIHKEEWSNKEMWRFTRNSDGSYSIANFDNLLCMDADNWGTDVCTNIGVYSNSGNSNQKWFIYGVEGGYVFRPSYSDLVMDLAGNNSADGTNIWLHTYVPGNTAQIYSIYTNGVAQYAKPSPVKPTLSVEGDTSIKVSWDRTMYTEKYIVYKWFGNDGWKAIGETKDTSYLDKDLNPNSEYFYKYESVSKYYKEESDFSSATTKSHSFSKWVIKTDATCVSNGEKIKTCSECGYSVSETIEKIDHNFIDTVIAPTCTAEGYTFRECTMCDATVTFAEKAKTPHNFEPKSVNDKNIYVCADCKYNVEIPFKGSGTIEDPYQISSKQDLENMRDLVNNEETEMRSKCYIQTADIDLECIEFEPIGIKEKNIFSKKCGFSGVYNGNNHQIINLKITGSKDEEGIGLFTSLLGQAVVENLVVYGEVETDSTSVGGICGRVVDGGVKIKNCGFIGNIQAYAGAGGIVGSIFDQCEIINCYHIGDIDSDTVGGIVGYFTFVNLKSYETSDENITIKNCYHSGALKQNTKYCGGITGGYMIMSDDYVVSVENCFYNKENAAAGMYGKWDNCDVTALPSNVLKKIADDLGEPFVTNTDSEFLEGYPVFDWQLESSKSVRGDLNDDGNLSSIDVLIFNQWLLGIKNEVDNLSAADMNDDGKVNIVDFCLLKEAILS